MKVNRSLGLGLLAASLAVSTALLASPTGADSTTPVLTITSTSESSSTITVNWTVNIPQDFLEYEIFTIAPGPTGIGDSEYNGAARTHTLTGLAPSTTYDIEIIPLAVEPGIGPIENSVYVTVTTDPPGVAPPPTTTTTVPPPTRDAPKIASLRATATTVTVRWLPVSIPLVNYVLSASAGNKVIRIINAKSSARVAVLRGLRPRTHYKIIVTAQLSYGSTANSGGVTTK